MFDRDEQLVVCNRRYAEMYQLPDDGDQARHARCASLLDFRIANGSFTRDPRRIPAKS